MTEKLGREVAEIGVRLLDDAYMAWLAAESECEQALRGWFDLKNGQPAAATVDVALRAVSMRLAPTLDPLVIQELERAAGHGQDEVLRINFRRLRGFFRIENQADLVGLSVPANVARRSKTDVLIVHTTP